MALHIYGDKSPFEVSSSEHSSRARGMLLAAKSFYIGGSVKIPYVSDGLLAAYNAYEGATPTSDAIGNMGDMVFVSGDYTINNGIVGGSGGCKFKISDIAKYNEAYWSALSEGGYIHVEVLADNRSNRFVSETGRNDSLSIFVSYGKEQNSTYPKMVVSPHVVNVSTPIFRHYGAFFNTNKQIDIRESTPCIESVCVHGDTYDELVVKTSFVGNISSSIASSFYARLLNASDLKPRFVDDGCIYIIVPQGVVLRTVRIYTNQHKVDNLAANWVVENTRFGLT